MVDIIKSFPHTATGFSNNTRRLQSKVFHPQINLLNNYKNNPTKRWIGSRPLNQTPLIDVSNSPYAIHRKVMYQQLSRNYPMTVDATKSSTSKQRSTSKETTKTSTTTASNGTYMIPQAMVEYGDVQSTRLFDTLSKHVTVKPEPIRAGNGLMNNPSNALTSWQRYWTSTHTQRRR